MDKQSKRKTNEEFGMEFGDINAAKYYELSDATKPAKKKKKHQDETKPDCLDK